VPSALDQLLSATSGVIAVLDHQPDPGLLQARLAQTVAFIPRLLQRPHADGSSALVWVTDGEFSLERHLTHIDLTAQDHCDGQTDAWNPRGDDRALYQLASRILNEPFDAAIPPWRLTVVDGVGRGRAALILKFAGAVPHGIHPQGGADVLSRLVNADRVGPVPPQVDIDAVIAADLAAAQEAEESATAPRPGPPSEGVSPLDRLRSAAEEIARTVSDPRRLPEMGEAIVGTIRILGDQLTAATGSSGTKRPVRRHIDTVTVPAAMATHSASTREGSPEALIDAAVGHALDRYPAHRSWEEPVVDHHHFDGPATPHIAGARLDHVFAVDPLAPGSPLRASVVGFGDQLDIALHMDTALLTRPDRLRGLILGALAHRLH